jgi:colanic acid biosynthesis glycosyl transferase WcaI
MSDSAKSLLGQAPRRSRILVMTQHYKPEPNFITAEVAEALARHSDIIVVTAHPNYPLGRFYSGRRFPRIQKSIENGVVVWRLPFLPDHSLSIARRSLSYLSFAAVASVVAPFVAGKPDIVWVYHGPFTTGLAALFFKLVRGSRLVVTCADLWPESFTAAGVVQSSWIISLAATYSRAVNRAADLIVCATRGTMSAFEDIGIPRERLALIPVWIEGTRAVGRQRLQDFVEVPRIVYAGNLGPAQGLETVIRAAAILREEVPALKFDIYGAGASENALRVLAARSGATNVIFHGRVPPSEAFDASASSLAQIVCLQRSPLFKRTIPSKLFAAFAASAPILYGLEGEAAELASESGGGIAFDSGDPHALVRAVKSLLSLPREERSQMRARLNKFFSDNFDPRKLVGEYEKILTAHSAPVSREFAMAESLVV